jgi:Fe-S cluster assembly protein SufD
MSAAPRPAAAATVSAAQRSFETAWNMRAPDGLGAVREAAMERFLRLGLPTSRDETWRYTNLRRIAATNFVAPPAAPFAAAVASARVPAPPVSAASAPANAIVLAIVDGRPQFDAASCRRAGLEIRRLGEMARADAGRLGELLTPPSDADEQRWTLLNTALFADGLLIRVTAGLDVPLVLVHSTTGGGVPVATHPRVIVDVGDGAVAKIVERHSDAGGPAALCNAVTQIRVGENSTIEHYRIFDAEAGGNHITTLHLGLARGARCKQFTIALGGALVRTDLLANLQGAGATLDSYALLVGHETRHVDCMNVVRHEAPHTTSAQTARSIASGTSRVVFNSKVIVAAGAKHAESRQSSRGLLLSAGAEIDTRPQLEIHTDEVKCAHGATTGRLDPNMLFYMLSRGIDRSTAQSLLVYAFLADVLRDMSDAAMRASTETALIAQLPDSDVLRAFR